MHEGVDVEISKNQKDELTLTGNSLENVSQSAADIQQICRVRNKDIRKVSAPCFWPNYLSELAYSFWMVCMSRSGATSWEMFELRGSGHLGQTVGGRAATLYEHIAYHKD